MVISNTFLLKYISIFWSFEIVRSPFGIRLGSVRNPFRVRSGSFRVRSGFVQGPFGSVRGSLGVRSESVRPQVGQVQFPYTAKVGLKSFVPHSHVVMVTVIATQT